MIVNEILQEWHTRFGSVEPEIIVRAPGRVNIIGEHTDYNLGYVMPGAMSRSLFILISRPDQSKYSTSTEGGKKFHRWVADDLHEEIQFEELNFPANAPYWAKYVNGAIHVFGETLGPLQILIGGDLPIGAGVSSSSALVCGLLVGFQEMTGSNYTKIELALLSSKVEREIIGLQGGIMDQFAIMLSQQDKVIILDCRDQSFEFIPATIPDTQWLLINTKVKHQLIDSDYNNRAKTCMESVNALKIKFPFVKSLRDVTLDMLSGSELPEINKQRCRYVIEENQRVSEMRNALMKKDAQRAGQLLKQSHHGLQHEYEVSCEELDHIAAIANSTKGVFGGRMMGGGFGGCVICLVSHEAKADFIQKALESYQDKFGFSPEVIEFGLSDGVEVVRRGPDGYRE